MRHGQCNANHQAGDEHFGMICMCKYEHDTSYGLAGRVPLAQGPDNVQ
jgi:hypothetical protein